MIDINEIEKEEPVWFLDDAITLIQNTERFARQAGCHLGLTGSVLFLGKSYKDLDIIVYPHKTRCFNDSIFWTLIKEGGIKKVTAKPHHLYGDDKEVWQCEYKRKRIDIFILK